MKNIKQKIKHFERFLFGKKAYRFIIRDWGSLGHDLKNAADVLGTMRISQQIEPFEIDCPQGKEFLVIAPHPDDEIIGPGGTILKMLENGAKITVLFLTSGKSGEEKIREEESTRLAQAMNFTPIFLGKNANNITLNEETINAVADAVKTHGKDGVFTTFLLDDHPDHRTASELLHLAYKNGKIKPDTNIWAYQVYTSLIPNIVVDITGVAEKKKEHIKTYQSQYKYRDWGNYALGLNAYNSRFLKNRNDAAFAELFLQIPMEGYAELCEKYFGKKAA